jgi:hypothetical protein
VLGSCFKYESSQSKSSINGIFNFLKNQLQYNAALLTRCRQTNSIQFRSVHRYRYKKKNCGRIFNIYSLHLSSYKRKINEPLGEIFFSLCETILVDTFGRQTIFASNYQMFTWSTRDGSNLKISGFFELWLFKKVFVFLPQVQTQSSTHLNLLRVPPHILYGFTWLNQYWENMSFLRARKNPFVPLSEKRKQACIYCTLRSEPAGDKSWLSFICKWDWIHSNEVNCMAAYVWVGKAKWKINCSGIILLFTGFIRAG